MGDDIHLDVEKISEELKIRPEIYWRIVGSFVSSLSQKMKNLHEAVNEDNRDQMRMILHEIKGTAGNLRLTSISAPESAMHEAVKSGVSGAALLSYYEQLKSACDALQGYVAARNAGEASK